MAFKTGLLLCTLVLGSLAVPVPEDDLSIFFSESRSSRIVGGNVAANGAHPWMGGISQGNFIRSFVCGGSIITPVTFLTAAHCIAPILSGSSVGSSARITVGTNRWNQGGQMVAINGHVMHERYDRPTIKNDIGVLYVSTRFVFNNNVRAVPLSFSNVGSGVQVRVAGWGAARANGPAQAQLMELQTATIGGNECVAAVRQASIDFNINAPHIDSNIEICTFHSAGRGTCQGDSGSALVRIDNGQQIGVVSWGFPCARGAPDMFARVSGFQSWLNQNIRN